MATGDPIPKSTDIVSPSMVGLEDTNKENYIEVATRPLDDVLQEEGIDVVRFIKIDVEGYESEVLNGARGLLSRGSDAPIISIEHFDGFLPSPNKRTDLMTQIREMNDYRFFVLSRSCKIPSMLLEVGSIDEVPHNDNIFCFMDRHIDELPGDMFVH